ncbi:MAG: hypothetical protein HY393_02475 [Candidatus Diapherotrites archaeon]|nr:hypothetical protein [Candidatus Diapherotrites archaeon]
MRKPRSRFGVITVLFTLIGGLVGSGVGAVIGMGVGFLVENDPRIQ